MKRQDHRRPDGKQRRPSHEGRGLKHDPDHPSRREGAGRPSHEGRGLKLASLGYLPAALRSPLTRGAWIETRQGSRRRQGHIGRPSHEGRGLKHSIRGRLREPNHGRPSHEGRGLKPVSRYAAPIGCTSPLTRGAWIETIHDKTGCSIQLGRPSHEGRGLKPEYGRQLRRESRVAPHTRGVD